MTTEQANIIIKQFLVRHKINLEAMKKGVLIDFDEVYELEKQIITFVENCVIIGI